MTACVDGGRRRRGFTSLGRRDLLVIMAGRLREGIYEHVVTRGLAEALGGVGELRVDLATIEKVDLPRVLARHIAREIEVRLRDLAEPDDQVALANSLLAALDASGASGASDAEEADQSARVDRAQRLHAIYRALPPARPMTPLGESTLLTRSSKDPVLGHELKSEIASSDTVDVIAAFITMGGIRQLWRELEALSNRGGKVRVLTTVFTGSTEVRAVEALAKLPGCEVRISYDVERTRLHAKAWLFSRDRGGEDLHTAYVGSARHYRHSRALRRAIAFARLRRPCGGRAEALARAGEGAAGSLRVLWPLRRGGPLAASGLKLFEQPRHQEVPEDIPSLARGSSTKAYTKLDVPA